MRTRHVIRLFKHYVPHAVPCIALIEFALPTACAEAGRAARIRQPGSPVAPIGTRFVPLPSFAAALQPAMFAVGAYGPQALQSMRFAAARLPVAIPPGLFLLAVMFLLAPEPTLWRSNSVCAMVVSFVVLILLQTVRVLLWNDGAR